MPLRACGQAHAAQLSATAERAAMAEGALAAAEAALRAKVLLAHTCMHIRTHAVARACV